MVWRERDKHDKTSLYFSVHIKDVWNAAKYGLNLFLSKDRSSKLPFLFQWNLK